MKPDLALEGDFEFFSTRRHGEVIWMNFSKNLLILATRFKNRETLLHYLDTVERNDEIKVLVLYSSLAESGHREYVQFFEEARKVDNKNTIKILCNVYSEIILKLFSLNKIVIHVTSDRVIPLFLNVSLACDYRIAADNTIYENSYLDMGVVPIGGGPFFLSKLLGPGKAYELLLLTRQYSADDALAWGIVDRVIPMADLETEALKTAHRFGDVPAMTLMGIKRTLRFSDADLKHYLDHEQRELFRILYHPAFRKAGAEACRLTNPA